MTDKTVYLGTDVATLCLFHPDDLDHRAGDPIAWYAYDFVYRSESAAGRLVAFGTGSDGGYSVKLTTAPLSPREATYARPSWTFPLIVRHGRVLIDNTDALPGVEQMTKPETITDRWFDLDNGSYRVTVHPIEWDAESDARIDGRISDDALPNYVVTFAQDDLSTIAVTETPPDLRPCADWQPAPMRGMSEERTYRWPEAVLATRELPALVADNATALLPRQSASVQVSEEVAEAAFPSDRDRRRAARNDHFAVAHAFANGGLVSIAWANGLSRRGDDPARLSMLGEHVARIERGAKRTLAPVTVAPIERPAMTAPPETTDDLKRKLTVFAQASPAFRDRLEHASFELERLASFTSIEAVTTWALMHLDLPFASRLAAYASPALERVRLIEHVLNGGTLPPPPHRSILARLFGRAP